MTHAPSARTAARAATLLVGAAIVLAATVAGGRPALACSCAEMPPPEEELASSTAVFAGEVVDTRELDGGRPDADLVAVLEVSEVWKGDVEEVVEVRTAADGAMCGYGFGPGEHLVYAGVGDDDRFTTHLCTRSAPIDRAEEDLAALGDGAPPLPGERVGDDPAGPGFYAAIAGIPVVLALIVLGVVAARRRAS